MFVHTTNWRDIKPPPGSQINWGHPLSQGLVGCWLMNEGGKVRFTNLVDNSFGVGTSMNFKNGSAYFNGVDSVINGGLMRGVLFNKGISIIARINTSDAQPDTNSARIWDKRGTTPAGPAFMTIDTNTFRFYWDATTDISVPAASNSLKLNTWQTIVAVFDRVLYEGGGYDEQAACSLYINGSKCSFGTTTGSGNIVSSGPANNAYIGDSVSGGASFVGYIDFIYVYKDILLSQSQIQSLYEAPYQFIQPARRPIYISTGTAAVIPPVAVGGGRGAFLTLGVG